MKSGTIYLYSTFDDAIISSFVYRNVSERKRAVRIWERRYAGKFNKCYLQISPNYDCWRVKNDGENQQTGRNKKYKLSERDKRILLPERKADLAKVDYVGFKRGNNNHKK